MAKQQKEESLRIYDHCVADALVKTGLGVGLGAALSVAFFKRKFWPGVFGAGLGIGIAYSNCQHSFSRPDQVEAYRIRASETATLKALKLKPPKEGTYQAPADTAAYHFSPMLADPSVTENYNTSPVSDEEQARYDQQTALDYEAYQAAYNNYYQQNPPADQQQQQAAYTQQGYISSSQTQQPVQSQAAYQQTQPGSYETPKSPTQDYHQQQAQALAYQQLAQAYQQQQAQINPVHNQHQAEAYASQQTQSYQQQVHQPSVVQPQQNVIPDAATLQQQHDFYNPHPKHHKNHHHGQQDGGQNWDYSRSQQ